MVLVPVTIACIVASSYLLWLRKKRPLHIVWDLDGTLICSIHPLDEGVRCSKIHDHHLEYIDITDDDFAHEPNVPNTRTFLRPGVRWLLQFVGWIAERQHVYTAAQGTYTDAVLKLIDPKKTIFNHIIHRDDIPHHDHTRGASRGKDLRHILLRINNENRTPPATEMENASKIMNNHRIILLDDRFYNFEPQPFYGIHVHPYGPGKLQLTNDITDHEWLRLAWIVFLVSFVWDVPFILQWFQSKELKALCVKEKRKND